MIGIVFLLQPWRTIKTVSINTMMIPTDKIATYANINQQTPYWRIGGQTKFIAQHIVKQDDQIDSAQVTLQGSNVNINIVEKVTAGYIEQGNNWYIINREGMFKKVQTPEGNAPVYANFKTNKDVKKLAKAFVSLELTLRQNISQIIFSPNKDNANRLIIIMNDGNTVYATLDTFGKKLIIILELLHKCLLKVLLICNSVPIRMLMAPHRQIQRIKKATIKTNKSENLWRNSYNL
ncbi:hypothetical protein GCM10025884_15520 [Leuconostoc gelidum subsp. gelidum]|nr:hypothetical protein GCM10025884_15520 [Leuconostoc gelidum subsp. gelidum]